MEILNVTSKIAAVLAVQMLFLTLMVSQRRVALGKQEGDVAKYPYQDGNDETLRRRIRAFGNFAEYVPMGLIMLSLMELAGAKPWALWALGSSFIVGRVLHSFGMLYNPRFPLPRAIGMFATYALLAASAVWLIVPWA